MSERGPVAAEGSIPLPDRSGATGDWRSRVLANSLGDAADRAMEQGKALIAAASRVILRSGGTELTMQNVAAEAGLSMRVLYRHFTGRDDLLVGLFEESNLVWVELIRAHVERFSDPLDRLGAALYFATDARQHTDRAYNAAMARFVAGISVSSPDAVGRARRPVVEVFAELVSAAMEAGALDPGDPEEQAAMVVLSHLAFQNTVYLGSAIGASLPSQDRLIRFCIEGLGGEIPEGWEARFHLSDEEAAASRKKTAELSGAIRQDAPAT